MGPTSFLVRLAFAISLLAAASACGPTGSPAGSHCTLANQCASNLCLLGASDGGVCVSRCTSSMDCPTGQACGRFDFRAIDPDSGLYTGPPEDVVNACRPRLNAVCSTSAPCTDPTMVCVGDPGVCTGTCTLDSQCASRLCLPSATATCGAVGTCAPQCDDIVECPRAWSCNLSTSGATGHGRCEPIEPINGADAACTDASM